MFQITCRLNTLHKLVNRLGEVFSLCFVCSSSSSLFQKPGLSARLCRFLFVAYYCVFGASSAWQDEHDIDETRCLWSSDGDFTAARPCHELAPFWKLSIWFFSRLKGFVRHGTFVFVGDDLAYYGIWSIYGLHHLVCFIALLTSMAYSFDLPMNLNTFDKTFSFLRKISQYRNRIKSLHCFAADRSVEGIPQNVQGLVNVDASNIEW